MTFDESVTKLSDFMFVKLYGKIDDRIYHRLTRLVKSIKKAHQADIDEQYMKAFDLGLKSGNGITEAIYNSTKDIRK